jgi:transposase-like protein
LKNDLMKLVRWFCLKLTYNDLASVVPILQDRLAGGRRDLDLKPDEKQPAHYRQFRVDPTLPWTEPPIPEEPVADWKQLQKEHEKKTGKRIGIVRRLANESLPLARPEDSPVDLNHHGLHTRRTSADAHPQLRTQCPHERTAIKHLFGVSISHQTLINYTNVAAARLSGFVDANSPKPEGPCAAYETCIKVNGITRYTWFILSRVRRAICGWNLLESRERAPALGLIYNYGPPDDPVSEDAELITDGLPSYDSAVVAYNTEAMKNTHMRVLNKHAVIGRRNLDTESETYREYKQLVERLNRTYKFHTRPRAGFKEFDGAVALTTLFVAYYNFMRPHGSLDKRPPVELECLQGKRLYPDPWVELLRQTA